MAKISESHPIAYVLETNIAVSILDGELWSREPAALVKYKKDLQALLFQSGSEKKTLSDLERESDYLQKALKAWRWAESRQGAWEYQATVDPNSASRALGRITGVH